MPEGLNEPKTLYALLSDTYMSNPMIDCFYEEETSSIVVRQFVGPQSRQVVHIVPWNDAGYTIVTIPLPRIEVPDDSMGNVENFLSRSNSKLERGMFVITDDSTILFRSYMHCREGDVLSKRTVMEEVNLGTRMFMSYLGFIVRAIDGEKFEDIFEEPDKIKGSNTAGEVPSEDVYVPASDEVTSKVAGGMYV